MKGGQIFLDSFILTLDVQLLYSVIIQLITTGILCTILSKLLYKPVTQFLEKRRERIENNINEANKNLLMLIVLKQNMK